jgi:hypothetical protein
MNQSGENIDEIDGQKYIVLTHLKGGKLASGPGRKIKLPIENSSSIRFIRASTEIIKNEALNSAQSH